MFFFLRPKKALVNDISTDLMDFYSLIQTQDKNLNDYLNCYSKLVRSLLSICDNNSERITRIYYARKNGELQLSQVNEKVKAFLREHEEKLCNEETQSIILDKQKLETRLVQMCADKFERTIINENKSMFNTNDLKENLITGFTSGLYLYFRDVYNSALRGELSDISSTYKAANFYFIREYCYGSMFRYNRKGEFNIPYGGMTYNRKDFKSKIDNCFSDNTRKLFANTELCCQDFEIFINEAKLTDHDFMFLDPPYDSVFSNYEGKDFTQNDQRRLSETLCSTKAKFIMIIKNTDFIYSMYKDHFSILCFDKAYTYNVRSRNERNTEHLIVTNIPYHTNDLK